MEKEQLKSLKTDVTDLLNQVLIKLKDIKGYEPTYSEDGYPIYNGDEGDENLIYLQCVKNYVEDAVNNSVSDLESREAKYYSSTCW